jgi:hypothetical protein
MPPRRTRQVAPPAPADDAFLPDDTPAAADAPQDTVPEAFKPKRARAAARRVQSATADPKVRLPQDKRAVEVADGVVTAEIAGRSFRLTEVVGLMPLMEWVAASEGVDTSNVPTMLSFYRVLQNLVHEDDWAAFRAHTREQKCEDTEFMAFQSAAMEALAARPTRRPATS